MEVFEQVMKVNLLGPTYVAKYAAVQIAKNEPINGERGVIIFVGSNQAEDGQRAQTAYAASKGGVQGMVMPMARDLGKYQIRVLAVSAGLFETPMIKFIPKRSR